jgi:hypothetical protein
MKYFFSTLVLIITLFYHFPVVNAQTTSCNVVTSANFNDCCTNATTDAQVKACQNYYDNPITPQQVGGSITQPTNALNSTTNTALTPTGTSAATAAAIQSCSVIKFNTLLDIAIWAKCIIGVVIIPGIFALAFVVFLWGVFKFIRASEEKDKAEGKNFIFMGLIGLFVMVSVWGILKILSTTLGIDATVPMLQTDYLSPSKASTSAGTTTANNSTSTGSQ